MVLPYNQEYPLKNKNELSEVFLSRSAISGLVSKSSQSTNYCQKLLRGLQFELNCCIKLNGCA